MWDTSQNCCMMFWRTARNEIGTIIYISLSPSNHISLSIYHISLSIYHISLTHTLSISLSHLQEPCGMAVEGWQWAVCQGH